MVSAAGACCGRQRRRKREDYDPQISTHDGAPRGMMDGSPEPISGARMCLARSPVGTEKDQAFAPISRPSCAYSRHRRPQRGPHRHRDAAASSGVRCASISDEGFPLVTTKKVHVKSIIHELLWFLQGSTNVRYLNEHGVTIWDEWADENGELGPRLWPPMALLADAGRPAHRPDRALVERLKRDPDSRRHIVSAWNVGELDKMALPPCHCLFQFYVAGGKALLPALSALRRHVLRRALQHRLLCASHVDDGAGRPGLPRASSFTPSATCISITIISSRPTSS